MTGSRVVRARVAFAAALLLLAVTAGLTAPGAVRPAAAAVPPGFGTITVGGLPAPSALAVAPDGRIFVAGQAGDVRVIRNRALLPTPFLHLNVDSSGERGLIGIALHPQFPSVPRVYVHYTVPGSPPHNRVSWFAANGDVSTGGENVITEMPGLVAGNHNGGAIHFGTDGQLYVAVGENAVGARAQQLTNPFGKILRVNPDTGAPSPGNPFADGGGANDDRIFAFGLRNPFTFGIQPGSGQMFINDVGQNTWEEVNLGVAGGNYGWPTFEGPSNAAGFQSPIHAYTQSGFPGGCAITGGTFYNPAVNSFGSSFTNDYFFADLCGGWIQTRDAGTGAVGFFATGFSEIVDLAVAPDGTLVVAQHGGSVVIVTSLPRTLFLKNQPTSGVADVSFTYGQSGDTVLSCDWDGNGSDTPGVFRDGAFLLRDTNTAGAATTTLSYGNPGDQPLCGDWNGDGTDTVGVYRGNSFFLRNSNTSGVADLRIDFGNGPGDRPLVGRWNGAAAEGIGVHRGTTFFLRNTPTPGAADTTVPYGNPGDRAVVGDWDGNGSDTLGLHRNGTFFLRNSNTFGVADLSARYGDPGDTPFKGNFDGTGGDGLGVAR